MNAEKKEIRGKLLMENRLYRVMKFLTLYLDKYYLDAIIGVIPGWGDAISFLFVVPYVYFSACVLKSIPLTLAVLNNALRDLLLGMLPFFLGDIIDVFHRSNMQNMLLIQGFIDGDKKTIQKVNLKALQAVLVMFLLIALIVAAVWLLSWLLSFVVTWIHEYF